MVARVRVGLQGSVFPDLRAEAGGRTGRLGYYLHGGRLQTDGLVPGFDAAGTGFFGKVSYDLPASTELAIQVLYHKRDGGDGEYTEWDEDYEFDDELLALLLEIGEQEVSCDAPLTDEREGDGVGLVDVREVADDAEEVAAYVNHLPGENSGQLGVLERRTRRGGWSRCRMVA